MVYYRFMDDETRKQRTDLAYKIHNKYIERDEKILLAQPGQSIQQIVSEYEVIIKPLWDEFIKLNNQ